MSILGRFSYFQTFFTLGVEQGLQKLPKFDINNFKLLFHLIPRKCLRKTPFKTQCPPPLVEIWGPWQPWIRQPWQWSSKMWHCIYYIIYTLPSLTAIFYFVLDFFVGQKVFITIFILFSLFSFSFSFSFFFILLFLLIFTAKFWKMDFQQLLL